MPQLLSGRALRAVCRALGDAQFKMAKRKEDNLVECTPEVRRIELQAGDAGLILASDGLWDVLSDSAAVGVLDQARCFLEKKPRWGLTLPVSLCCGAISPVFLPF